MSQTVHPNPMTGAPGVVSETPGASYNLSVDGTRIYDLALIQALTLVLPPFVQKGYKEVIEVWLRQGAAGGHSVTLPSGVTWEAGSTPTIATTANSVTIVKFTTTDGSATWSGYCSSQSAGGGGGGVSLSTVNDWTAQQYFGAVALTFGGTVNWNLNTAQCATITLTGNCAIANPTNMQAGGEYVLALTQDGTGSRLVTSWGSNIIWLSNSGSPPTLSTTPGHTDLVSFFSPDGTHLLATAGTQDGGALPASVVQNNATSNFTAGYTATSYSLGTVSSGTVTLAAANGGIQHMTANGAFTLAPQTVNSSSIQLDITNGASAGAITISGYTMVVGSFDTTNGHKFRCISSLGNAGSLLTIQAMQ